jgi:O-antigen biosynthesis protein WbqP
LKRICDIVAAALALAALSPLLLLVAALIRVLDGSPVLFRQRRVGRGSELFTILKFRSMAVGCGDVPSTHAARMKVTAIGKILRRTNVDELPQFLNVIQGHMSLVGPRPSLTSQQDLCRLRAANGAERCRPGLTGLAQIHAYDGMPESEKANWDGEYWRTLSFLRDVKILLGTFGYLLRRPPVY